MRTFFFQLRSWMSKSTASLYSTACLYEGELGKKNERELVDVYQNQMLKFRMEIQQTRKLIICLLSQ